MNIPKLPIRGSALIKFKKTEDFKELENYCKNINNPTIVEMVHCWNNKIIEAPKCKCGLKCAFKNDRGYIEFCSNAKCEYKIKDRLGKARKTCLEKYGVENPYAAEEVKEKIKETCLERYGAENPSKCEDVIQKIKETKLERYGDENYCNAEQISKSYHEKSQEQKDSILEKRVKTNIERYGIDVALNQPHLIEGRYDRQIENIIEKYGSLTDYYDKRNKNNKRGPYREDLDEWNAYRTTCWFYTGRNDLTVLENYEKRGLAGIEGAYQLDHIISIKYGYDNNISPKIIGHFNNLIMLPWEENLSKGPRVININIEKILEEIK